MLASYIELGERPEQPSEAALAEFNENLNNLSQTIVLARSLEAAQFVAKTLATLRQGARESIHVPEGHVLHVLPDIVTGTRSEGDYSEPRAAFGSSHDVQNLKKKHIKGGHYAGETFEADRLVVIGNHLYGVDAETGRGCQVPEPPEKHILLHPVPPTETQVQISSL